MNIKQELYNALLNTCNINSDSSEELLAFINRPISISVTYEDLNKIQAELYHALLNTCVISKEASDLLASLIYNMPEGDDSDIELLVVDQVTFPYNSTQLIEKSQASHPVYLLDKIRTGDNFYMPRALYYDITNGVPAVENDGKVEWLYALIGGSSMYYDRAILEYDENNDRLIRKIPEDFYSKQIPWYVYHDIYLIEPNYYFTPYTGQSLTDSQYLDEVYIDQNHKYCVRFRDGSIYKCDSPYEISMPE